MKAIIAHTTIEKEPKVMGELFVKLHTAFEINNDDKRTSAILVALKQNIIDMKSTAQFQFLQACSAIKDFEKIYQNVFKQNNITKAIQESDEDSEGNVKGFIADSNARESGSDMENGSGSDRTNSTVLYDNKNDSEEDDSEKNDSDNSEENDSEKIDAEEDDSEENDSEEEDDSVENDTTYYQATSKTKRQRRR
jgi:hypothetical protein